MGALEKADHTQAPAEESRACEQPDQQGRVLLAKLEELQQAVQARDEFISMIAHEMRNPMTPLLMQVNALLLQVRGRDGLPERIVRSIELLNVIVEDFMRRATVLLDVSRMSSGIYRLECQPVDWSAILQAVVRRMQVQASHVGVVIHCDIEAGITGHWDALALEQIADNLLSNAIKYGECRPVQVSLRAEAAAAVLSIRDQGRGISQEDRARIFMRFERAVASNRSSGFGIGLWLVGRLAEEMEGSIAVDSTPGEGSTFSVRLPLSPTGDDQ